MLADQGTAVACPTILSLTTATATTSRGAGPGDGPETIGPSDQTDDEDEVSRRASLSVLGYHSVKHCIEARPSRTSTTCETSTPRASSPRAPSSASIPTTGAGVRGRESVCAPSLRVLCARLTRALPQATLVLLGRRPSCVHSMSHDVRGARSRLRLGGFAGGSGKTQLFGL